MTRNYWLHRITGGDYAASVAKSLLDNGHYLSIGWSFLSTEDILRDILERGIVAINEHYAANEANLCRNRWCLLRFLTKMQPGDYVVVPQPGMFSVYKIADDKILSNETFCEIHYEDSWGHKPLWQGGALYDEWENEIDLGFYRKVVPVKLNIPRETYTKANLISRMKIRQTNTCLNGLEDQILDAINAFEANEPINLKAELLSLFEEIASKKVNEILSSNKFERLVEWYLKSLGANWIDTPAKNSSPSEEGDADKLAFFEDLKLIIMVQVKKHDETTTHINAVRQIVAYKENNSFEGYSTIMWVISTCKQYSEEAKQFAEEKEVRLITGSEFTRLILERGLSGMNI